MEQEKLADNHGQRTLLERVRRRRHELLALWAAGRMKTRGAAAIAYAQSVAGDGSLDDEQIIRRVAKDLEAHGLGIGADTLRRELQRLNGVATLEFGATPNASDDDP